ncbi:MAG: SDR family oxidoreductase [Chitinophagaceae bacterium]|nr:SDR family oxidoreductase [Chitinophagaceae bacterium]
MKHGWLHQKSIVVIGGTSGMGLAAALSFIEEGANVVAVGLDEAGCREAAGRFNNQGVTICADATEPLTAVKAIKTCAQTFGSFDGLYHVAGGSGRKMGDGPLHELTLNGWNKTFELNLTSLMLSNQAAVKWWLEHEKPGTLLNMSSVLGVSPSSAYFATHAYAACKAAVAGFTRSVAAYYAKNNIRVNAIAPALVETPMAQRAATNEAIMSFVKTKQPLDGGRIGNANDLNGLACYFMSDHSKFTTAQIVYVDGGWGVSDGQIANF